MKSVKNKRSIDISSKLSVFDKSDLPIEKFGTETELEKQVKVFLNKQLETKISLKEHYAQHRAFTNPSTFTPLTQLIHGQCSLKKFQEIEVAEEKRQELQRSGLSEDEIKLLTDSQSYKLRKEKGLLSNPEILNEQVKKVQEKLAAHKKELEKPEAFRNLKILSRHEMEIERTLYVGCDVKKHENTLIAEKEIKPLLENDPFKRIKELSEKLSNECRKKRKRKSCKLLANNDDSKEQLKNVSDLKYNPSIHHVIVPLEEEEVRKKKLHIEEIRNIPRFANYETGVSNKVLFLKNLHPKIDICELQSLFSRFEFENLAPINYRILTGKMKGQAFLEFANIKTAEKALEFANGYMLRDKPIIIQYGRQNSSPSKI